MMRVNIGSPFDAAPFGWPLKGEAGVIWEDPREIHRVVARFKGTLSKGLRLLYWRSRWPDGRFVPTGKQLEVNVSGQEGTEVYTGYGPSQFRGVNIPFVLIRRKAKTTVFRAVIKIPA